MAIVQGSWSKLLAPGLAKSFKSYVIEEGEFIKYVSPKGEYFFNKGYVSYDEVCEFIRKESLIRVRELHVYDLGDGMLVPCQMVDDLFA